MLFSHKLYFHYAVVSLFAASTTIAQKPAAKPFLKWIMKNLFCQMGVQINQNHSAIIWKGLYRERPKTTKSFLIKSKTRAFETVSSKLGLVKNISKYDWKPDYIKEREAIVQNMTVEQIRDLASKYLDTNKMVWLIVGDAKTQLPCLTALGFTEAVLLKK